MKMLAIVAVMLIHFGWWHTHGAGLYCHRSGAGVICVSVPANGGGSSSFGILPGNGGNR